MSGVILFMILSFMVVDATDETPAIIVNDVTLKGTEALFYTGNIFFIVTASYKSTFYSITITCITKYSASCKMMYNGRILGESSFPLGTLKLRVTSDKTPSFSTIANHKDHLIYHEYEEGDYLTLSCSVADIDPFVKPESYFFTFGNATGYDKPITIKKQLNYSDNNTTFECTLVEQEDMSKVRQITLLLHIVKSNSTTRTTVPTAGIIILGLGGTICILALIYMVVYRIKKQSLTMQRDPNANNEEDETSYQRIQLALPKYGHAEHYPVPQLEAQNEPEEPQSEDHYNVVYDHFIRR